MKHCPLKYKIYESQLKILPNTEWTHSKWPNMLTIAPQWQIWSHWKRPTLRFAVKFDLRMTDFLNSFQSVQRTTGIRSRGASFWDDAVVHPALDRVLLHDGDGQREDSETFKAPPALQVRSDQAFRRDHEHLYSGNWPAIFRHRFGTVPADQSRQGSMPSCLGIRHLVRQGTNPIKPFLPWPQKLTIMFTFISKI